MQCLIVDDVHLSLIQNLESAGIRVIYKPDFSYSEDRSLLKGTGILVIRSRFFVDDAFMSAAPDLFMIARAGAGLDNIDLESAQRHGIEVFHASEGNADAVGEHTLGLILGLLSKIASSDRSVRTGFWEREKFRGTELKGKTVGLLGYGNMGRAVSKRLSSFGCEVISYDKYLDVWPDQNAVRVDLQTLKEDSQILSLHIPLTTETQGMIDRNFLKSCRKGLFLINTSRGKILPLQPLPDLLEDGTLSGVGLDVLEDEPPVKNIQKIPAVYERLFGRDDVLLTPHVAGWSLESYKNISIVLASKIVGRVGQLAR